METEKKYETSVYQRRAYNAYLLRNKDNVLFKERKKEAQRKYYHTNKVKVLEKLQLKRNEKKLQNSIINLP